MLPNPLSSLGGLLPLFDEKAAIPVMVKHSMHVQRRATEYLNPGQVPVTACDKPLFAIAKSVQWNWPASHREDVHEMALWSIRRDLLEASGWTAAFAETGVATTGRSDSFLSDSGHQINHCGSA